MLTTNLDHVPGKKITAHHGLVMGNTVRTKHIGRDFFAGLKNIVGGELKGYTELMIESREQALSRLIESARQRGANAVINIRFSTSDVAPTAAEVLAYGTAVTLVDESL